MDAASSVATDASAPLVTAAGSDDEHATEKNRANVVTHRPRERRRIGHLSSTGSRLLVKLGRCV
jgi:hypothetical protein